MNRLVSRARAMAESALRTFIAAAVPAFVGALAATNGNYGKAALLGALAAAAAAGLAALGRVLKPIQTDHVGVGVAGVVQKVTPAHSAEAGYPGPGRTGPADEPPTGNPYDKRYRGSRKPPPSV